MSLHARRHMVRITFTSYIQYILHPEDGLMNSKNKHNVIRLKWCLFKIFILIYDLCHVLLWKQRGTRKSSMPIQETSNEKPDGLILSGGVGGISIGGCNNLHFTRNDILLIVRKVRHANEYIKWNCILTILRYDNGICKSVVLYASIICDSLLLMHDNTLKVIEYDIDIIILDF